MNKPVFKSPACRFTGRQNPLSVNAWLKPVPGWSDFFETKKQEEAA